MSGKAEGTQSVDAPVRIKSVSQDGLKQSNLYIDNNTKLRSLPNGVKDEIRSDGKGGYELVKRVGVGTVGTELITDERDRTFSEDTGKWTFNSPLIYISNGVLTIKSDSNYRAYMASVPLSLDKNYLVKFTTKNKTGQTNYGFQIRFIASKNYTTNGDFITIGKAVNTSLAMHAYGEDPYYSIDVDYFSIRELITDSAVKQDGGAKELDDNSVLYELETPIIAPLVTSGSLISRPSGTVYVENVVANAGVYTTKYDVTIPTLEIKSIESITKIDFETAQETKLDVSLAVISDSSFTHPNLANGDIVFVVYEYQNESLNAPLKVDYYDSRYTVKDSVTNKFYKWSITVASGVPTIKLIEA